MKLYHFLFALLVLPAVWCCDKDSAIETGGDDSLVQTEDSVTRGEKGRTPDGIIPGVVTLSATGVRMFSASFCGEAVLPSVKSQDFELGFEISTSATFQKDSLLKCSGKSYDASMNFTFNYGTPYGQHLEEGTQYYFRAYMVNDECRYYGDVKTFTTETLTLSGGSFDESTATVTAVTNLQQNFLEGVEYGVCFGTTGQPETDGITVQSTGMDASGSFSAQLYRIPMEAVFYRTYLKAAGMTLLGEVQQIAGNEVTTGEIDPDTWTLKSKVKYPQGFNSFGVCYGQTENGLETGSSAWESVPAVDSDGFFTITLKTLTPGTVYYRAFAQNFVQDSGNPETYQLYGDVLSFDYTVNTGYTAVDLGLSVKWATFNVGAGSPENFGDYFAWGDTETYYSSVSPLTWKGGKSGYRWNSYFDNPTGDGMTFSKYSISGGKITLDSGDDAASVLWGGDWRMPTQAELKELKEECTWTWTSVNGVNGYKVASRTNSNSIFLPGAGSNVYQNDTYLPDGGEGRYWGSTLSTESWASMLRFDKGFISVDHDERCNGYTIRPVCE